MDIDEGLFELIIHELNQMVCAIIKILNFAGLIFKREEVKDFNKIVTNM